MVCHETYKDKKVIGCIRRNRKKSVSSAVKKTDKSSVKIGPVRSVSKSKKNTIDPETMIKQYGADAVDYLYYQIAHEKIFSGLTQL